jgi:hypothetical protein
MKKEEVGSNFKYKYGKGKTVSDVFNDKGRESQSVTCSMTSGD